MDLSGSELLIVLVVVVILFGSSRLPKLARSLGEAQREFRHGVQHAHDDDRPEPNKTAAVAGPTAANSADAPIAATAPLATAPVPAATVPPSTAPPVAAPVSTNGPVSTPATENGTGTA